MNGMEVEILRDNHNRGNGHPSSYCELSSDSYEREFTLALLANERTLLQKIENALKLIKEGKYGMCQATGKPIRKARLAACPWTKYCIEYARLIEKSLVRPGEENEGQR